MTLSVTVFVSEVGALRDTVTDGVALVPSVNDDVMLLVIDTGSVAAAEEVHVVDGDTLKGIVLVGGTVADTGGVLVVDGVVDAAVLAVTLLEAVAEVSVLAEAKAAVVDGV